MSFSILEAMMLICFGISWPFAIIRSYRARSARGKSVVYLIFVNLAYLSGILHKALVDYDIVLILYALNFVMVSIDIALYFRNTLLDNKKPADSL